MRRRGMLFEPSPADWVLDVNELRTRGPQCSDAMDRSSARLSWRSSSQAGRIVPSERLLAGDERLAEAAGNTGWHVHVESSGSENRKRASSSDAVTRLRATVRAVTGQTAHLEGVRRAGELERPSCPIRESSRWSSRPARSTCCVGMIGGSVWQIRGTIRSRRLRSRAGLSSGSRRAIGRTWSVRIDSIGHKIAVENMQNWENPAAAAGLTDKQRYCGKSK